ncbi:MAG TPA: hypothetical protein QF901_14740, partial [Gammaproteobacteria bacterium]|nr:hypothetical protein [Gammaproteobacteria bacterium]
EEITKLPLLLKGTMLAGRRDPFASAIVQHKDRGQLTMTYFIGNEVLDKVYLDEVLAHEVILRNERENKLEHPPMLEPYEIAANTSAVPAPRTDRATRPKLAELRANTIKLNQKEIHQRLLDEYVDIATKVDVKEHKDANGKVIGLTSSNVSQIGLAKDLGLQDNDILTTINNQPVDSTDSILKVLNRFAGARSFRIGIIRGGKQQYLNYSLK